MTSDQRLEEWRKVKPRLWGMTTEEVTDEKIHKVFGYLVRSLVREYVPHATVVMDYLEGRTKIPSCGFLGCPSGDDHCH